MAIALNHTIVWCRDKRVSARYLTEILGLPDAKAWGLFLIVEVDNGVSLDFHDFYDPSADITAQHYAFLIDEVGFDATLARLQAREQDYWADPLMSARGEINHNDGGRGVYFQDPDQHLLEVITRPYGS
jgi:catechol 2,3-dioxygenase-like lactoylglutathione lyase family enzyme